MRDELMRLGLSRFTPQPGQPRPTFRLGLAVQRACALSGLKQDAVAAACGKDSSQFAKEVLNRRGCRVDFDLLVARVDDQTFWRALLMQISDHFDMQFNPADELLKALAVAAISLSDLQHELGKQRMAKAELRSDEAKTGVA
jgi:hypothetical protein